MKYLLIALTTTLALQAENWPMWRGSGGVGISNEKNLPLKWSTTENIAWKVALPYRGNSTPVIWGEKIFLTQPMEEEQERALICLDRLDGKVLWRRTVKYTATENSHRTNPYCSESPATDGERVVADDTRTSLIFIYKVVYRRAKKGS